MNKFIKTAHLAALAKTNGGVIYLLPEIGIKMITFVVQLFLWRMIMSSGAKVPMTPAQMLTYTYISAILADMLVVQTPATGWLAEGVLPQMFGRPFSVFGQLAARTVGGWSANLLLFSLPMALVSPLLGVRLVPASLWFFPSLALCMLLGFAIDLLFACLSIKLRNMYWLIGRIRMAIVALFSGTIIPIALLPLGLDNVMKYQPFAALGGASLSIFIGGANVTEILLLQCIWNLILWPLALLAFHKSRERMVSYGG